MYIKYYEDSGSDGESGAGEAWYKIMDKSGNFSSGKMVRIIFNDDGTRDVEVYSNTCGVVDGKVTQLKPCQSLGFI